MQNKPLRDYLESKQLFLPLLNDFLNRSIAEQFSNETSKNEITYAMFYEQFAKVVYERNADNVFAYCESPIERIFLNSVCLMMIKNARPCFHITPAFRDTEKEIYNHRLVYNRIDEFIKSYKKATRDHELSKFEEALKYKQKNRKLSQDQVDDILVHNSIVRHFEWNSYHLTPQASFPNFKIRSKSIRADLLIWVPGDESVKIIVECDGYSYHKSKDKFETDRERDRLFQLNGYKVIRFSGGEIFRDPVHVSSEIVDLLEALDTNKDRVL